MKLRVILLAFVLCKSTLFAYDAFTILNKEVPIDLLQSPAVIQEDLTPNEAYKSFRNNKFKPLPAQSSSFGFRETPLWIGLEIVNRESLSLYLNFKNPLLKSAECFVYQNDQQIPFSKSGTLTKLNNRINENPLGRYKLLKESTPTVYLIKIISNSSLPPSLQIGTLGELQSADIPNIIIYTLFAATFLSLFLYNFIVYLLTRERGYLLFSLHIVSFFIFATASREYFDPLSQASSHLQNSVKFISLQAAFTLLLFFMLSLFNVKKLSPLLYKSTIIIATVSVFLYFFIYFAGLSSTFGTLLILFEGFFSIYAAISVFFHQKALASVYLLALSGFFAGIFVTTTMMYGFIPYTDFNHFALLFGSMWEMIVLSLALGYQKNVKNGYTHIALKHEAYTKMLFLQSRYASMGETVGNITHQWKQPLNAIGSIQNSIKAALIFKGEISKDILLSSVETSFKLLHHLSETIDTFYRFLSQQSSHNSSFILADEFETIRKITQYSFENSKIELRFLLHENPTIEGSANEFTHALLNLILNAKDALENVRPDAPAIIVQVDPGEEHCTISVTDNAGGIKIKPINSIFDQHISSKEERGGMGVGLYMAKNIIEERFGGTVSVANKDDGACFTITLPYAEYGDHFHPVQTQDEQKSLAYIKQLTHKIIELEEIEKTLKKWSEIFMHARWGIAIRIGSSSTFESTNTAFNEMYGYSPDEIKTITVPDLFAPEYVNTLSDIQKRASEEGYVVFETLHQRKGGSVFPALIELIVIKDEAGNVLYHIANIWDLTEQKRAEERLLLKKFALDHIQDAVYLVDEQANFHYVNEATCHTLGYSRHELEQMHVGDLDHDFPQEGWLQHWNRLKEVGSVTMEQRHKRKDNTLFPVEVSANYIQFGDKHYSMAIARDITERKAAEENLLLKEFALNHINEAVFLIDENSMFHYVNTGACRALGYTYDELISMGVSELDPNFPIEQWKDHWKDIKKLGTTLTATKHKRKDGTLYPIEVSSNYFEYNGVGYSLAVSRDMTERLLLEAEKENRIIRTITEHSPDIIVRFDTQGRRTYLNPKAEELFSIDRSQLVGKTLTDMTPVLHKEFFEKNLRSVITGGQEVSFETAYITASGSHGWAHMRMVPEFDSQGIISSVLSIGRDITERKAIEEKLKRSEASLNDAQKLAKMGSWALDIATDTLTWSDETYRIFELQAEQTAQLHKTFYEKVHPDDREKVNSLYKESVKTKTPYEMEHRIVMADGRIKYVLETCETKYDSEGNPALSIGTVQDITERKLLEKEIADSYHFLNHLIDSIPDPIFVKDKQHRWVLLNQAFCTLIGKPKDELIGKSDYDFFPKAEADIFREKDELVFNSGEVNINEEYFTSANGVTYTIETVKSVFVAANEEQYLVGTIRDITERKQMEMAIEESRYAMEEAQKLSHIGSWKMDLQSGATSWSDEYFRILEIEKENMEEFFERFIERVHPDDRAYIVERFTHWQQTLEPYETEHRLLMPDGRIKYVLQRSETRHDEAGNALYAVGTIHDITERKEYQLHAEMIETAVRHSNDAMYILDPEEAFRFTFVNDAACRMTGYSKDELLAMTPQDLDPSMDIAHMREVNQQITSEKHASFESMHRRKDGTLFPIEHLGYKIHFGGKPLDISIVRDITERKAMEEALRQSEEQFRTLADNIPDPIFQYDREGYRVYVNNAVLSFTGKSQEELLGGVTTDQQVVDDEHGRKMREIILRVAAAGVQEAFESRVTGADGNPHYFHNRYVPVFGSGGTVQNVIMVSQDITAQKNVELLNATLEQRVKERTTQLSEKEREFRTLAENLPDFLVRYDKAGRRIYVNRAFSDYFGIPPEELVGSTTENKPLAGTPSALSEKVRHVLQSGETAVLETYADPNGEKRWWNIIFTPEFDAEGEVAAVLSIAHDITAIKEAQIELHEREEKFYSVFRLSPAAVSVTSLERGIYLEVNDSFLVHTKYTRDEVVGKSSAELNIFVDPDARAAFFKEVIEKGFIQNFEYAYQAKDGSTGYAAAFASVMTIKGEKCLLAHSYDISPRKQMEVLQKERLELEARLSKIAAAAPGVHYIFEKWPDETVGFTYLPPSFEALFGLSGKTALEDFTAVMAQINTDDRERIRESIAATARSLTPWHEEFRVIHPNKGEIWIEGQSSPETQSDGVVVWYGFFHDVTERKAAEKALHESEEKFRAIVENSPDVIARYDLQGHRTYVNPKMQELLDRPLDEILGRTPADYSPLPESVRFEEHFAKVIAEKREILLEGPYRTSDGNEYWGEQRIVPEFNAAGEVISVMVIGRDLTERKKAEAEIRLLERALNATEEGVWLFDISENEQLVYVNEGASRMLGYAREEILEMGIVGIDRETTEEELHTMRETLLQTKHTVFTTMHTAKDGRKIPVELDNTLFESDDTTYILATARDISAQEEAQRAIAESEQRYRDIFENSQDALYVMDITEEGRFLNVDLNAAFERSTGMKHEELVGRFVDETVDEATAAAVISKYRRCVEAGVPMEEEIVLELPVGRRAYRSVLIPVREKGGGRVYRIVGLTQDITDERRTQHDLALIEFALEHIREAVILADEAGQICYVNKEMCLILEYSREELLELAISDIDPDWTAEEWTEHLQALKNADSITFPGHHRTKDGALLPVDIISSYFEFEGKGYSLRLIREIAGKSTKM